MSACSGIYGYDEVFESDPSLLEMHDAIYVPIGDKHSWGVFDVGRRVVPTSCYFRGPDPVFTGGTTPYLTGQITNIVHEPCLYAGFLNEHFGHFLLSTLSRLWPFVRTDEWSQRPIICHCATSISDFFAHRSWASEMISGLGLRPEAFVSVDVPTRFGHLAIPAPSFEETNFAHAVFADLCHKIGRRLTVDVAQRPNNRPAYLSKERLTRGVRKIANERDAVGLLREKGVEIIYPETMIFVEQVAFWRDRACVASFVSSALHASIFAPGKRIVAHSDSMVIGSSFAMIDKINDADARYLGMPDGGIIGHTATPEFAEIAYIADPRAYAEAILEAIETK